MAVARKANGSSPDLQCVNALTRECLFPFLCKQTAPHSRVHAPLWSGVRRGAASHGWYTVANSTQQEQRDGTFRRLPSTIASHCLLLSGCVRERYFAMRRPVRDFMYPTPTSHCQHTNRKNAMNAKRLLWPSPRCKMKECTAHCVPLLLLATAKWCS